MQAIDLLAKHAAKVADSERFSQQVAQVYSAFRKRNSGKLMTAAVLEQQLNERAR